jgi:hypothetical protein
MTTKSGIRGIKTEKSRIIKTNLENDKNNGTNTINTSKMIRKK